MPNVWFTGPEADALERIAVALEKIAENLSNPTYHVNINNREDIEELVSRVTTEISSRERLK